MAERAPGIIVRTPNDTGIITPPLFERYPVYIGEGDPYKLIENQEIVRSAGSVDSIRTDQTVNSIVSVGDLPGVTRYVSGTDYSLVGNNISWNLGATTPTLGNSYFITFTETRAASAYQPTLYFNENLIYADHGNKARTNGAINDVSVGGYLGINAGARGVVILQLDFSGATDPDNPTGGEWETALQAGIVQLNTITDWKLFLVGMSSGTLNTTTAANLLFNHAVLASQPERKQERTVIAAQAIGTTVNQAATFAQTYGHERMVTPFTYGGISKVVGIGFDGNYDTRFYNAALIGKFCSKPIGINISDEILPNINLTGNFTPTEVDWLLARGVGVGRVREGVVRNTFIGSTDTTSALTEDLGVLDTKDYVKKYWREKLWEIYKNRPINASLLSQMTESSENMLEYLISEEIISEKRNVAVTQDGTEPRKARVYGQVKPAFGLQWVDVEFTFVLSFT